MWQLLADILEWVGGAGSWHKVREEPSQSLGTDTGKLVAVRVGACGVCSWGFWFIHELGRRSSSLRENFRGGFGG